ncbi:MAG: hypothetical protein HFH79_10480 [Lachnospiraceae bacterium]|nr:hypothetical protein [Lachnospiraceae bacterium]
MEMNINHELRIESKIPFQSIEDFHFEWKTNQHAVLEVNGYIDPNNIYGKNSLYGSMIRIWKEQGNETLFHGCMTKATEESVGELKKIHIEAQSASCRLDQQAGKRSFQAVEKTYAEVAREVVEENDGQIICTEGDEKQIGKPMIQYNETVWAFVKRLASYMGTCVVADIISGESALWFGMRNGNTISPFIENEYSINVVRTKQEDGYSTETVYETESRQFYKLGDRTVFCGQRLVICRVSAYFHQGELIFSYLLKGRESVKKIYQESFIGLGLTGTIIDVRNEQIKVALDIDGGKSTGDYYYDWYPETGNTLYAMPEKGARVELCFGSWDESEGGVLDVFPSTIENRGLHVYRNFHLTNANSINLHERRTNFTKGSVGDLSLYDGFIIISSSKIFNIIAKDAIQIYTNKIMLRCLDELSICQN